MFLENIRSGDATASEYVCRLGRRASLILTGNVVKHEQKKKDKSARLLKELESETRNAVNLARHVCAPSADGLGIDPGKSPRDPGSLGRSVVTPLHSNRTAEPILYRNDLFQRFALDYAANEDKIRKLYEELERETQRLHVLTFIASTSPTDPGPFFACAQTHVEEKLATTVKRDKWREKNYIKGLTLTRKSCEGLSPRSSGSSSAAPI